jgi:DNA-binding IclR family transcriptional regulator
VATPKSKRYNVPALDKGLDILEFLSSERSPRSQAEIAAGLERGVNEIYRMLVALEARGYLRRDETSGKYQLSLKLYYLSHSHSPLDQLTQAARGPMQDLADQLRQSCHISIIYDRRLMVVAETRSPDPISLSVAEGTLFPLASTVSGRVLLAFSEPEQQELLLESDEQYVHMNQRQRRRLRDRFKKIQDDRFDLALEGFTEGVTECAAIVGNVKSGLIAALCVAAMSTGLRKRVGEDKLVKALMKTTRKIDRGMGL